MPKKKEKNIDSEKEAVSAPVAERNGAGKTAGKRAPRKPATAKGSSPRNVTARKRKAGSGGTARPSHEEISLRAYFIAEQRLAHGLPGDANTDWLEARRQLYVEAGVPLDET